MLKRILKISGSIVFGLVITIFILLQMLDFRWSNEKFIRKFTKYDTVPEIKETKVRDKIIRSIHTGHSNHQPIIFLHGSPGSSKDFERYLKDQDLQQKAYLVAIDRPGYGYSDYGNAMVSVKEQANYIAGIVPDSSIIIGHSLGGPIAGALAMYYPKKAKDLILLAPAVDPENEKQFVNHIIGKPIFKWVFSKAIKVTIEEKLSHEETLSELMNDWRLITCPTIIMHGKDDWIVPSENVAFLQKMLVNAPLKVDHPDKMDHMMIWSEFELVKSLILERIETD